MLDTHTVDVDDRSVRGVRWATVLAGMCLVAPAATRADVGRAAVSRLVQAPGGPLWMATPGELLAVGSHRAEARVPAGAFGPGPLAPVLAASSDGTLYVARFDGLYLVRADRVRRVPAFTDRWVTDVVVRPDDPHAALVTVATTGGLDNGVYATHDDGARFESVVPPTPLLYYESVRVAPSRPSVVYVTGYGPAAGGRFAGTLWASQDGGERFIARPLVDPAAPQASDAKLLAVNPVAPAEIYLRFDQPVAGHAVYLRSRDAGATYREMLVRPWEDGPREVPQPFTALDGSTLAVATRAGLLVSRDDGAHFARMPTVSMPLTALLAAGGERLYVAGDAPAARLIDLASGKVLATRAAGVSVPTPREDP